jgi:membrane-associated phospholipid phosphatase
MDRGKLKYRLWLQFLILCVVISSNQVFSQLHQSGNFIYTKPSGQYFISYFTDLDDFLIRPLKWDCKQLITATAVTATGLGLYFYDEPVRDFFVKQKSDFLNKADKWFFDPLGIGLYMAPVVGIMYFAGDERAKGTSLAVVKAYGYGVGTAVSLKYLLQRARPSHYDPPNPYHWDGPFGRWKYDAFPSGHATLSFAMATVIALEYRETIWVPVLCYSLATLISLSRIQNREHWPSDVLIGAALGFGVGKFVHRTSKHEAAEIMQRFN